MKKKIIFSCIMCVLAAKPFVLSDNIPGLLVRSSQILKFEAKAADTVNFISTGGHFQTLEQEKIDKNKQKPNVFDSKTTAQKQHVFSITSQFIESQNAYKLLITDSNGGVIVSDQSLDQAPADGYQPTGEFIIPVQGKAYEAKKYVYCKTQTNNENVPSQYSRLELDMTVGKAKLIMDINAVANPGGLADLKYDQKAQQKLVADRLGQIEEAVKNKTATEEQLEEMNELMMLQQRQPGTTTRAGLAMPKEYSQFNLCVLGNPP